MPADRRDDQAHGRVGRLLRIASYALCRPVGRRRALLRLQSEVPQQVLRHDPVGRCQDHGDPLEVRECRVLRSGAVIAELYPREQRGRAYGFTSVGWAIGAVLGVVRGGLIVTYVSWR